MFTTRRRVLDTRASVDLVPSPAFRAPAARVLAWKSAGARSFQSLPSKHQRHLFRDP